MHRSTEASCDGTCTSSPPLQDVLTQKAVLYMAGHVEHLSGKRFSLCLLQWSLGCLPMAKKRLGYPRRAVFIAAITLVKKTKDKEGELCR